VGVELATRTEHHRVVPPLGIGELHAIADDERTSDLHGVSLPDAPPRLRIVVGPRA